MRRNSEPSSFMEEEFKDEEDLQIFEDHAEVMGIEPNFKIKNGETVRQTSGTA